MFNRKISDNDLLVKTMTDCPLFSELSTGEIKSLLGIAHIREYSNDEKIFTDGTIGLCFYLIVTGTVNIIDEDSGKTVILKEYKKGSFFSEVHLFSETNHSVSCTAKELSKLIIFAKPDFEEIVKIKPKLGNKVLLNFLDFFGQKLDELYKENKNLKQNITA